MAKITVQKTADIVQHLLAGCGTRATAKLTNTHRDTVSRVILRIGEACNALFDEHVLGVKTRLIQQDEIYSFLCARKVRIYTALSMEVPSRLILAYSSGPERGTAVDEIMMFSRARTIGIPSIYTDGFRAYASSKERWFGADATHGILVKETQGMKLKRVVRTGERSSDPDRDISTSFIERLNGTLRGENSRFVRKTLKHSKNPRHHAASLALTCFAYNFVRQHQTLRVTPAMEADLSDHIWAIEELIESALEIAATPRRYPTTPPPMHPTTGRPVLFRQGFEDRLAEVAGDLDAGIAYLTGIVNELKTSPDLTEYKLNSRGKEPMRSARFHSDGFGGRVKVFFVHRADGSVELSDLVVEKLATQRSKNIVFQVDDKGTSEDGRNGR